MANTMQLFEFETHAVRTVTGPDGEPWFVAGDVCAILGLGNVGDVLARLDADEKSSISANIVNPDVAPAGGRAPAIVSEAGLYRLVLTSRKPKASRFRRWVTHEVLPSLRKTGVYMTEDAAADPLLAQARMLVEMRLRQLDQERRLAEIEERIEALPAPITHLSVLAFANLNGIRLDNRAASFLGRQCAALTRLAGGIIGAVPDDHHGTIGAYPLEILDRVFAEAGLIADEDTIH